MGTLKDELIDTEERWNTKCQIENFRCSSCGIHLQYNDRDTFFSTKSKTGEGLCSTCVRRMGKTLN